MNPNQKVKDLQIKLLEAKLEAISGKKVVYQENKSTEKKVVKEGKQEINENVIQWITDLLSDPTMVDIAGEQISKGAATIAMLAAGVGLPALAYVTSLLQSAGGDKKKALQAIKNTPKGGDVTKIAQQGAGQKQPVATTTTPTK